MPLTRARTIGALVLGSLAPLIASHDAMGAPPACSPGLGRIVSVQGKVELRRAGSPAWHTVDLLDTPLCEGDVLHTGARSRAAVVLVPETFARIDQHSTLLLRPEQGHVHVEMYKNDDTNRDQIDKACGAGYFITRLPRAFKVYTPFLNAAVEGTEFQVALACDRAHLAVFEGRVAAQSTIAAASRLLLSSGESTTAAPGEAPTPVKVLVRPADAVQWALFYPPLSDAIPEDLDQPCSQDQQEARAACLTRNVEGLLKVGRVDEAQERIRTLTDLLPLSPDALALASIISLTKNDKQAALEQARQSVEAQSGSSRGWLALSYAQQAHFDLDAALHAARMAARLSPGSALLHAREAELLLSLGEVRQAERVASAGAALDNRGSRALTVLGFVQLTQIRPSEAASTFRSAIERDSTDPLPRLGLGLAMIREGDLAAGREQIEIAVALDPLNSLLRSYVGKAYYEENTADRDQLAAGQYALARQYDPKDPTPLFYSAILNQSLGRLPQARSDLEASVAANDNRAVYRSRLLLDQDRATRQVRLTRNLGEALAEQRALDLASEAVAYDPGNYSAHAFLMETYARRDRHEIGRVSEYLQSQLLRPLSLNPFPLEGAYTELNLPSMDAREMFTYEASSMFERNRLGLRAGGVLGSQDTRGTKLGVTALHGPVSASADYFRYDTDGFRRNSDLGHEIFGGLLQAAVTPELSIMGEYRRRMTRHGDIALDFDPQQFAEKDRNLIDQNTARLGLTYRPSPRSTWLFTVARHDQIFEFRAFDSELDVNTIFADQGATREGQYQHRGSAFSLNVGFSHSDIDVSIIDHYDWTPGFAEPCPAGFEPCDEHSDFSERYWNGYAYLTYFGLEAAQITLGLSRDGFRDLNHDFARWNPKFGLRVRVAEEVTLRTAAFRTLKRPLIAHQTIEPTQVGGFSQFYDDVAGTASVFYTGAVDWTRDDLLSLGVEAGRQKARKLVGFVGFSAAPVELADTRWARLDSRWHVGRAAVVTLGATVERLETQGSPSRERPTLLRTVTIPWSAIANFTDALQARFSLTNVWQSLVRKPTATGAQGRDHFAVVDIAVRHLLPRRRGMIELELRNALKETFNFQDDDFRSSEPRQSPYLPVRRVLLKAELAF